MRDVPDSIQKTWRDGLFVGERKPIVRATVQHPDMFLRSYTLMSTFRYKKPSDIKDVDAVPVIDLTKGRKVRQRYADFLFTGKDRHLVNAMILINQYYTAAGRPPIDDVAAGVGMNKLALASFLSGKLPSLAVALRIVGFLGGNKTVFTKTYNERVALAIPMELPNIKSVQWTRSVDVDVADCTITCWNTAPLPIGKKPDRSELDMPGYYTPDRGATNFSKTRWGHVRNEWFGMLMPDNIIRTYEGYGTDEDAIPELDENLVQTGTWIIDTVTTSADGTLTIKCRDIGRILLDQMYLAPVVPDDFYNEDWQNWDGDFPGEPVTKKTKLKVKATHSSNEPWYPSGVIAGHKLSYAFDGDPSSYWLSVGNAAPSRRFAYEWVECTVGNKSVTSVRVRTKKKNYTCYISVKVAGVWQGKTTIDYHRDGIGQNGGNIKYVKSQHIGTEGFVEINLPKTYDKVEAVRVTLGNLQNFHFGTFHYRAGIRDVEVYGKSKSAGKKKHLKHGPAGSNPNRYNDYTDIVKLLCAWGGFFWPDKGRQRLSDGTYRDVYPVKFDTAVLGKGVRGRVWGDFLQSGTTGPAMLDHTNFDKKSLMDGISYIRDILGFIFHIDETGAVQWRLPNIHDYGCRWSAFSEKAGQYRKRWAHPIREKSTLLDLTAVLDGKNVTESFFVGDVLGKIGAFAPGFNPNPTGLRRIRGWTDQNFETQAECELMADMLSLRQLFLYRTDKIRIPANPAIQIDDQVQVFERVTAEGYIHYVKGISSSIDMTTGEWVYDLDTHWLGFDPKTKWLFNPNQLNDVTQKYIAQITDDIKTGQLDYNRKAVAEQIGHP